jgi:hypothetical protein
MRRNDMEQLQDIQQAEQFIRLLLDADRQREAKECRHLLEQIDDLERQLETVGRELKSLKGQLGKAERGTPERHLKTAARHVEREVREAKEQIREIKDSILSGMGKAVRDFKRKGVEALDGAIDKLHIRVALRNISRSMERAAINMQKTIDRINAASEESQQTKIHKRNISRALMGKERETIPEEFRPGILARSAIRPFETVKELCGGIQKQADALEERVVRLSRQVGMDRGQETRQEAQTQGQQEFQEPKIREWGKFQEPQMWEEQETRERRETIQSLQEYKKSLKGNRPPENYARRGREGMEL